MTTTPPKKNMSQRSTSRHSTAGGSWLAMRDTRAGRGSSWSIPSISA